MDIASDGRIRDWIFHQLSRSLAVSEAANFAFARSSNRLYATGVPISVRSSDNVWPRR